MSNPSNYPFNSILVMVNFILDNTSNGRDLSEDDLTLCEQAHHDRLPEKDYPRLLKLYETVADKTYQSKNPNLYQLPDLYKDETGSVYYKGVHVDWFDYEQTEVELEYRAAMMLHKKCVVFEHFGIKPTLWSVKFGMIYFPKYMTGQEITVTLPVSREIHKGSIFKIIQPDTFHALKIRMGITYLVDLHNGRRILFRESEISNFIL